MNASARHYSKLDYLLMAIDQGVRTLTGGNQTAQRSNPATDMAETALTRKQQRHSAGLMRVNHVGEVCAQALYAGQSLTARAENTRTAMQQAALEENDHLVWCRERLQELNSHTSYLNPLWYGYSLALGVLAGLLGDAFSLGFIVETERQVIAHLENHLQRLPARDQKSRKIIAQMREDESHHASSATQAGAKELPSTAKFAMKCMSKVMTTTAYWL
ncbi:MAG: 2-polyprenyl-3-methyl-6-methoxy-1,4-benzoquinone monooxygenase [Gammaproteobacteria bacterium]